MSNTNTHLYINAEIANHVLVKSISRQKCASENVFELIIMYKKLRQASRAIFKIYCEIKNRNPTFITSYPPEAKKHLIPWLLQDMNHLFPIHVRRI